MNKIKYFVILLLVFAAKSSYTQENLTYLPFNQNYLSVPLNQNFSLSAQSTIDNTKISFDIGPINQSGNIDISTAYSIKYTNNGNQFSGNRGYWNFNIGNINYEQPSGPFINQSENTTDPSNFTNDMAFIKLRQTTFNKKDLAVVKDNGLYVYRNDNYAISSENHQYIPAGSGKFLTVDNFNSINSYEDIAVVSNNQLQIKIFKNDGYGNLETSPVTTLNLPPFQINMMQNPPYGPTKAKFGRIYNQNEPYNRNPNAKSDLIVCYDSYFFNYSNNSDNTFTLQQSIFAGFIISDFEISDLVRSGWNDIVVVGSLQNIPHMKVFRNSGGQINTEPVYSYNGNGTWFNTEALVTTADLSRNVLKDIIVASKYGKVVLYQNTGDGNLFSQQPQTFLLVNGSSTLSFDKIKTVDIYNTGGLALLLSRSDVGLNNLSIFRFNPTVNNTIPSPPIITNNFFFDGTYWRPHLYLNNNNTNDFNHYELFKKSPDTNNDWISLGSVYSNEYIDNNEFCIASEDGPIAPANNCFYSARNIDNTDLVSNNSNSVGYRVGINNPYPIGEFAGDNISRGNKERISEMPKNYSVSNFPNPFNPVTNIYFSIPKAALVTIKIYNSLGQEIKTLTDKNFNAGSHVVEFNAGNLASGIYFYRITSGSFAKVNKLILIK